MVQHLKHVPLSSLCFVCPLSPWSIPPQIFQSCHLSQTILSVVLWIPWDFVTILFMSVHVLPLQCTDRGQRTIYESQFFTSTMGDPGLQLRSSKLSHLYPLSHLASPDFLLLLLFCILMFSALFWEHFSVIHPQFSSGLLSQRQFCPYDEVGHV